MVVIANTYQNKMTALHPHVGSRERERDTKDSLDDMSRITKVCAAPILAKDGILDFLYLAVRVLATITLPSDLDLVDSQYWNIFLCSGCFNPTTGCFKKMLRFAKSSWIS